MRTPTNERVTPDIAAKAKARTSEPDPARPGKQTPERKCVLTGETAARARLIRLALAPDGNVLPDIRAKAPGRGAWIGVNRAELEDAITNGKLRGALSRAFKTGVLEIPADLPHMIEQALIADLLDRLGLELRAGQIILGSGRIADTARAGDVALLCHASDASEDGRAKLDQAWRVGSNQEGSGKRGLRLPLDRAALSVALGRENVVHFGVRSSRSDGSRGSAQGGNASDRVMGSIDRLLSFQGVKKPLSKVGALETACQLDDKN